MSDSEMNEAPKPGRKKEPLAFHLRATCTVAQACAGTGLGRTLLYELMGEEKVRSTTVGRRRLIIVPSLLKAVGFQPAEEPVEMH